MRLINVFVVLALLHCLTTAGYTQNVNALLTRKALSDTVVTLSGDVTLDLVHIKPGTFVMGATQGIANEQPTRKVTISREFYIGMYEITQEQWFAVMGTKPWLNKSLVQDHPKHPAVYISWEDAQAFVKRLNAHEEFDLYRLPTEAEWEYVCRADTNTEHFFSAGEASRYAWYRNEGERVQTQSAGQKSPNPWGLFDIYGNVQEWVQDWYGYYKKDDAKDPGGPTKGIARVFRGGSFLSAEGELRATARTLGKPTLGYAHVGFRIVRQVPRFAKRLVLHNPNEIAHEMVWIQSQAAVPDFYMDQYEVTVEQYLSFVESTNRLEPAVLQKTKLRQPNLPVTGVSWYDAKAYCQWAGFRLPRVREWEMAARGMGLGDYPWGDAPPDPDHSNFGNWNDGPVPGGQYLKGISPYGVHDLSGNVYEWVQQDEKENASRGILKGGSWKDHLDDIKVDTELRLSPDFADVFFGFRCVYDP